MGSALQVLGVLCSLYHVYPIRHFPSALRGRTLLLVAKKHWVSLWIRRPTLAMTYFGQDLLWPQRSGVVGVCVCGVGCVWGVVWCGVLWCVWCGVVWCGVVWCGVVWCGVVWCGVVWCGVVWCGVVVVWCGVVCGVVWCGVVWCGVVWCGCGVGVVWCGVVWCGVVWCGVVWWCGVVVRCKRGDNSVGKNRNGVKHWGEIFKTRTPFWHDMVNYGSKNVRKRSFFSTHCCYTSLGIYRRFRPKGPKRLNMPVLGPEVPIQRSQSCAGKSPNQRNTRYVQSTKKHATEDVS